MRPGGRKVPAGVATGCPCSAAEALYDASGLIGKRAPETAAGGLEAPGATMPPPLPRLPPTGFKTA